MADLMATCPQVIPALLKHGMACVGCSMARFETLASAAAVYELDLDDLLDELGGVIDKKRLSGGIMNDNEHRCLVCGQSSQDRPLFRLEYQDRDYFICPEHFPLVIHQPEKLVGLLPGAEKLKGHAE